MAGLGFDFRGEEYGDSLFGNRAVIYTRETKGIVIVWDFIADTVASWSITNPSFFDQVC